MIVGLVFGVMSVVILNNYSQSPIQNAYANYCPGIDEIYAAVKSALSNCMNDGHGSYFVC